MRYVNKASVAVPNSLKVPGSRGAVETSEAIAFYADTKNKESKFDRFEAYSCDDVRAALEKMFFKKCAYCETSGEAGFNMAIEHFRPKGEITENYISVCKKGYYWLGAAWSNLLLSCAHCNGPKDNPNVDGIVRKGKWKEFPIESGSKRAQAPTEELLEKPLLIQPCEEDPHTFLEFTLYGGVKAKNNNLKGIASIEVYSLDRIGLVRDREKILHRLRMQIENVEDAIEDYNNAPDSEKHKQRLDRQMNELKRFAEDDQPYSGICAAILSVTVARWASEGMKNLFIVIFSIIFYSTVEICRNSVL